MAKNETTNGAQMSDAPSGYPDQSGALAPDIDPALAEAKAQARAALVQAEQDTINAAKAEAERIEAEHQFPPRSQEPVFKVDGSVKLRYLGPDDLFIFGDDKDGNRVQARPGDEVSVSAELADYCMALPHDHFEKVS
jgi:hypothetical protein